jgi:hypothetical protein
MSLLKMPYEVSTDFFMKALIYGQPGIGKSTLALSMPKAVLIDCDNGVHRIAPSHRVPFLPVKTYDEINTVLASSDMAGYDTIVIDTAGKLLDYMSTWIIKNNPKMGRKDGALTLQGFGARKYEFINLLKRVSTMGKHLIFVAHEIEKGNDEDRIIRPEVGGSSGGDLIKELDLVGYMEALGKKRTISFSPCGKYYAKNSARIDDTLEVPELNDGKTNEFMTSIVEQCKTALKEESTRVVEYNKLMDELKSGMSAIENTEDANAYLETLGKTDHIWDSKIKCWILLQEKAEQCGLCFVKETKQFKKIESEETDDKNQPNDD